MVKSYSLEELAEHHNNTQSNVSRYVSERDYNELLLRLETAEQNAAEQRDMKAKAREQHDEQVKKNKEIAASFYSQGWYDAVNELSSDDDENYYTHQALLNKGEVYAEQIRQGKAVNDDPN